jgi:hypothetical protein
MRTHAADTTENPPKLNDKERASPSHRCSSRRTAAEKQSLILALCGSCPGQMTGIVSVWRLLVQREPPAIWAVDVRAGYQGRVRGPSPRVAVTR